MELCIHDLIADWCAVCKRLDTEEIQDQRTERNSELSDHLMETF